MSWYCFVVQEDEWRWKVQMANMSRQRTASCQLSQGSQIPSSRPESGMVHGNRCAKRLLENTGLPLVVSTANDSWIQNPKWMWRMKRGHVRTVENFLSFIPNYKADTWHFKCLAYWPIDSVLEIFFFFHKWTLPPLGWPVKILHWVDAPFNTIVAPRTRLEKPSTARTQYQRFCVWFKNSSRNLIHHWLMLVIFSAVSPIPQIWWIRK